MEVDIFPAPEVSGVLTREYVESRLHNDHPDDAKQQETIRLQDELQGTRATPYYIVLDPVSGEKLAVFEGADFNKEKFRAFLLEGVEKRKEKNTVASRDL